MRRLRAVRSGAATVIVGALLGYVVAAMVAPTVADNPMFGGSGESPIARRYMLALIDGDTAAVHQLRQPTSVAVRANDYKSAIGNPAAGHTEALTYLGGAIQGPISVHSYVVAFVTAEGEKRLIPFALSIAGGKVVHIE
jgi:hypothetical protein